MTELSSDCAKLELMQSELEINEGNTNLVDYEIKDAGNQVENGHLKSNNGHALVNHPGINDDRQDLSDKSKKELFESMNGDMPMTEVPLNSVNDHVPPKKTDTDTEEDTDTLCGFGSFKPKWLQPWATAKTYLTLHSIIGVVSGTYYAYRVGVMSTLEKRFAFKSKTTGVIMIFDEITPLFFGALVGYFGGKMHRPRILGLGVLVSVLCCFISALPYFIYGPSKQFQSMAIQGNNISSLEQCDGAIRTDDCGSDDRPPTVMAVFMWMIAGILKGFGNLAYYSIGLSYLDDNSKKKNTPMYFAVAFVLRLFGPLLGFLMSSICLKFYENPFDDPGFGPDDPRWIGAWWIGFVLEGFLLLLVAIPVSMFPRRLPGLKKPVSKEEKHKTANFKGMLSALKRLFLNPLFMAIILNDIISVYGTVGHHVMLPKYMEHQFRLTASDASLYSGVPSIAAIMVAVTLGGYLIWKFRPTLKFLLGAMIISEIIGAVGFLVLMIPKCEKLEMANFGFNDDGLILEGACNANCSCSTKSFTPACGADGVTQYFSPCYAGCTRTMNKTFYDCSCVMDSMKPQSNYVTEGFCMSESCWLQALAYIVAWPIIQFIVSLLRVMQKLMLLRCTQPQDKSLALGVFEGITCILGFVPYLIIFGAMVDSVCLVWEASCEETGNCWFYDTDKFSNILHGMSAGFSALSVLTMYLIYRLRGRMYDLYDEDGDIDVGLSKKKNIDKDVGEIKPINE